MNPYALCIRGMQNVNFYVGSCRFMLTLIRQQICFLFFRIFCYRWLTSIFPQTDFFFAFGLAKNCQIDCCSFFFLNVARCFLLMNLHVKYVLFFFVFSFLSFVFRFEPLNFKRMLINCGCVCFWKCAAQPTLNIVIFNIKLFASFWHHRKEKKRKSKKPK